MKKTILNPYFWGGDLRQLSIYKCRCQTISIVDKPEMTTEMIKATGDLIFHVLIIQW